MTTTTTTTTTTAPPPRTAFAALRRFADVRSARERCDLCSRAVGPSHRHLMEASSQRFVCACDACALLFADHPSARFRALPTRPLRLDHFAMTEGQWDALGLPVNMAFFAKSGDDGRVSAQFPGPSGATESAIDALAWRAIEEANPILLGLLPEVQALLVNRVGGARDHYLVPIDAGFRLAGLLRGRWQGFSGGAEVWEEIGRFFDRLRDTSKAVDHA